VGYEECLNGMQLPPALLGLFHPINGDTFSLPGGSAQGIDDALIQPYSGHESRQSLEIYSRLSLAEAQPVYEQIIGRFPIQ